ncbi:hypothetical protein RF11_01209 [Thelohanellus kitauei]|uniref:Uncharacterized protein n=1 Tax=Thelohanellus kitauei TaxID=669202 RepID=A0A0C2JVT2_THEKT|nr:hypothetical protein RF11_05968 [Thelohanellus kitauei]KII73538.1 hypothetical protein RF11_01209 [Thelohanellus kitauei]
MNKFMPYVRKFTETQIFIGHVTKGYRRFKNRKNKWYVIDLNYPDYVYKPYVIGFAKLIRRNIFPELASVHSNTHLIPMEDIHMSYLVLATDYRLIDEHRLH